MKTTRYYTCEYCYKEYVPKRRGVQKYCSNSCRSNACRLRNSKNQKTNSIKPLETKVSNQAEKQMSLAGVGNAAAGAMLANTIKTVFTKEDNKAATKGDLKRLTEKLLGRYHLVNNLPVNSKGEYPYFDLQANVVVYFKPNN
ncbi:hypothetical protein [uncultured Winogradskyella sp.]|uniref:hypothetical protein n=1 Tax=uncultured Winogradskyella sp. TaxID=395353 RepID=UPI00261B0F57|nr:hypothetical protein [uncultured Winogradskyella sp.]